MCGSRLLPYNLLSNNSSTKAPIIYFPFKYLILWAQILVLNTELITNISFDQFSI